MKLELTSAEAETLLKYLEAADKYYEEMENCGIELTNDEECNFISKLEKQLEV